MPLMTTVMRSDSAIFTDAVAAAMIGVNVPVNVREHDDGPVIGVLGTGVVVAAEPVEQGWGVELTVVIE